MKLLSNWQVRRSFKLITLACCLFLLGACLREPEQALRLGTNLWLGYEPLYLARRLGNLKPEQVKLVEYVSATQVMRGLIDGTINAGALTLEEAILLYQQDVKIQIILVMDYSAGADALVARPEIKSLADLKGKRVGVETTALGAYMMNRTMERGDLRLSEVTIVPLEFSQHEQAYLNGKVDAVVTFEPVRSHLMALGAISLLDSSELPGEVVDILVVRKDVLKQQQSNIASLLEVWFTTCAYLAKNLGQAVHVMTARQKLDKPSIIKALQAIKLPDYKKNHRLLTGQSAVLDKQAAKLASIMLQNDLLASAVQTSELFDSELLQKLYP